MTEIIVIAVIALGLGLAAHLVLSPGRARTAEARATQARESLTALERAAPELLRHEYVAQSEVDAWKQAHPHALRAARQVDPARYLDSAAASRYRTLAQQLGDPERTTQERNQRFVQRRMQEDAQAFDRIERYPLTARQREAIVTNQDTTLVIAGAGTGKTSTVVGKVEYLVRRGLASPSQILVVAFDRQAAEELRDRLSRLNVSGRGRRHHLPCARVAHHRRRRGSPTNPLEAGRGWPAVVPLHARPGPGDAGNPRRPGTVDPLVCPVPR
jgi:hypothetical protein